MKSKARWTLIFLLFLTVSGKKPNFQPTGNEDLIYKNGIGGECQLNVRRQGDLTGTEVICSTKRGWVKNQIPKSNRRIFKVKVGCQYYKKSTSYDCFGSDLGDSGPVTCTREISRYFITPQCGGTWLEWSDCDKTCGGGVTRRVKFKRTRNGNGTSGPKYEKATEYRPCNTHECPKLTEWEPRRNINGSIEKCETETCTRKWQRYCAYSNTTVPLSLCSGDETGNASLEYEVRPCAMDECRDLNVVTTTTEESVTSLIISSDVIPRSVQNKMITTGMKRDDNSTLLMPLNNVEVPRNEDNLWLGFFIGFAVAALICLVIVILVYKRVLKRKIHARGVDSRAFNRSVSHGAPFAGSLYLHRSALNGTIESGSYLQPDTRLTPPTAPPTLHAGETFRTVNNEEGIYWMVPPNANPQTQSIHHVSNSAELDEGNITGAERNTVPTDGDPLYSDIPAFSRMEATHESYSSSEFESESDGEDMSTRPLSSITDKDSSPLPTSFEQNEDGCKSFDSDESRDVVRTLRKPASKLAAKRSSINRNEQNDVFLSEEEMQKEDYENERRSAFSVRYSKILAKKYRQSKQSPAKGNQPVEAGFQWIGSRHWSNSTNSESSFIDQSSSALDRSTENYDGHKRPTLHRHSSGASSSTSFNLDTATSGYNSAFGDSTDDEYAAFWSKGKVSSRRSLRESRFSRRNLFGRDSRRSLKTSSLLSNDRRVDMWDILPRESSSLFDPRISKYGVDAQIMTPNRALHTRQPFNTVGANCARSMSLISKDGRIIPVEDIYSSPVDAEVSCTAELPSSVYDVPFDIQVSRSAVS